MNFKIKSLLVVVLTFINISNAQARLTLGVGIDDFATYQIGVHWPQSTTTVRLPSPDLVWWYVAVASRPSARAVIS